MPSLKTVGGAAVTLVLVVAILAGLAAAYRRFHVEAGNRRVEIAVEWQETVLLAQATGRPLPEILARLKQQHVSTLVIAEDTITTLEQSGDVRPIRTAPAAGSTASPMTTAVLATRADFDRVAAALAIRGIPAVNVSGIVTPPETRTTFVWSSSPAPDSAQPHTSRLAVAAEYSNLRTLGLGLPPDAVDTVSAAGLRVAGRIGNFPGVNQSSAHAALTALGRQHATTLVFSGDEILGFRNREVEKAVAEMLRIHGGRGNESAAPGETIPVYGAVEFGKQKGDEKLSIQLKGDFVRVHTIQTAEMGQMEEDEAIDRFVRAAKERNIRFCYVRLLTFAGPDPLGDNEKYLHNIAAGMMHGNVATGGDMGFGPARAYPETEVSVVLFALTALGAAAGLVWLLNALTPLPDRTNLMLLTACGLAAAVTAVLLGEAGRKLIALAAGMIFPTLACLLTYPGRRSGAAALAALSPASSLMRAVRAIIAASATTSLGIVQVVGLLATRPFMMRANQFLGIKVQHAAPIIVIAAIAVAGGVIDGESWRRMRERVVNGFRGAMDQPAKYGMLALGIVALAAFALVVARTGNDAGVGVSGAELKVRAILDRVLPVRPRTKEFLVGHPAFVLAMAWWWRGRKRLAIPAFVVGSLGQVSLLNTFCHIHTPLIISVWRDGLGLLFGVLIGAAIFIVLEILIGAANRSGSSVPTSRQGGK